MTRIKLEIEMLEPGEQLQVDLGAWTPWRQDRLYKNTLDAYLRWKKEREAKCQQSAEG